MPAPDAIANLESLLAIRAKLNDSFTMLDVLEAAVAVAKLVVPVEIAVSGNAQIAHAGPSVLVASNSGSSITYTIQPNATIAIPLNSVINLSRRGAGAFLIAAGVGVTLNLPSDRTAALRAQHSGASLHQNPLNTWWLAGDLELVDEPAGELLQYGGETVAYGGQNVEF